MCKNRNCRCCRRLIKTICIEASSDAITLTVPPCALGRPGRYCIDVCTPFPALAPGHDPTVEITDGTHIYPCYTSVGEYARAHNVTCDRHWSVYYGKDPEHVTILRGVAQRNPACCSGDGYTPVPH